MFKSWKKRIPNSRAIHQIDRAIAAAFEPLEKRQLMSASHGDFFGPVGRDDGGFGGPGGSTITFSLAPTAVQTGLDRLATADGLTDPTSTQVVRLGNTNGVETYSVTLTGTGTISTLTVDQLGDAVTAPTRTTTTWATLSGSGTGSDAAAASEITAIANALSLTAPASTDSVDVTTTSAGAVSYSIHLSSSSTSTSAWNQDFGTNVSVDSAGNPIGNQALPFSVFSTTIQNALNAHAPTGATALTSTSTQNVDVQTVDGIVTYSTTFTVTGTQTKVTVDSTGALVSLPATTTTTFSALSSALQTELQTLATADGVTTTIASTQTVNVLTESTGAVIYSVTLSADKTDPAGNSFTVNVTVSVDSSGNPTTLPRDGGSGGFAGPGNGADCGPGRSTNGDTPTPSTNASGGTTNSSGGSTTISLPNGGTSTAGTTTAGTNSATTYALTAKLLSVATNGLGMLGGYFVEFAPATVDSAVQTDLQNIQTATTKLATDTRALTKTEKATLKTDTKAISTAIKAIASTLAPLESTLKTDAKTWKTTIAKDQLAVRKARGNATALAAAQAQLATDKAAAFVAITRDQSAIQTAIESDSGVKTAEAKLASDLPTIGSDISTIQSDQSQLVSDIEASTKS